MKSQLIAAFTFLFYASNVLAQSTTKTKSLPPAKHAVNLKVSDCIGIYEFELSRDKNYLIRVFDDGTLTGEAVLKNPDLNDYNKPYSFRDDNTQYDKGSWRIISSTVFMISWSDIPDWKCTVRKNGNGKVTGFVENSGQFVKRVAQGPYGPMD